MENPSAPALIALEAQMVIRSTKGERVVNAEDYFVGPAINITHMTVLQPDELLTAIRIPATWAGAQFYFEKVRDRQVWDFPLVNVASAIKPDKSNGANIGEARVVVNAVAATPKRLKAVEVAIAGKPRDEATADMAGKLAVEGAQTLSFWAPVDPVKEASLRCVAGSHKWPRAVMPTRWLSETSFYPNPELYMPVPDPDAEPDKYKVVEWAMEPGDAVAFNYKTLHGARGNLAGTRRRAFSLRLLGDDARYVTRPGRTSPPFPGHDMVDGQRLREDWFPVLI